MTKELENRILLLYTIFELGGNSKKKDVLDFIINNDLIVIGEEDKKILKTRKELKWRNELAYVRQHLVEIEALNKYEWSITPIGKMYYNSLIGELQNRDSSYILTRIKKPNIFKPIDDFKIETIEDIYKKEKLTSTEIEAIVLCRKGQGSFRKSLIQLWNKCSVTNYADTSILTASHIKPWKNSDNIERLDKYNGFLLTPNLDKLFDKGLITFDYNDGKIILSEYLKNFEILGINRSMKISIFDENKKYLKYHNDFVFRNNSKKKKG